MPRITTPLILLFVGLAAVGVGLAYAVTPADSTFDCGSLFVPTPESDIDSLTSAFCEAPRNERIIPVAIAFLAAAAFLFIGIRTLAYEIESHDRPSIVQSVPAHPTVPQAQIATQLAELARMRDAGELFSEEFVAAKAKLLS